ncbi:MAG: hypothetical protein PHC53_04145 [Patescibacteria group bacterium]|nr:hypothetical protein [Patescibacteria group bacterium]
MATTNKFCACGKPVFKKDKCRDCYLGRPPDKVFRGNVCKCGKDTMDRSQKYCPDCRDNKFTPQSVFDPPDKQSRHMRRLLREQVAFSRSLRKQAA